MIRVVEQVFYCSHQIRCISNMIYASSFDLQTTRMNMKHSWLYYIWPQGSERSIFWSIVTSTHCKSNHRGVSSSKYSYGEKPKLTKALLAQFEEYLIKQTSFRHISRSENSNVDALAKLASSYDTYLVRSILVEILHASPILEPDLMDIKAQPTYWMDPIKELN